MNCTFPEKEFQFSLIKCPCRFCNPQSHRDVGFTDEEFLESVDFFRELMRLDEKGKQLDKQRLRLTAVLRTRHLIEVRKSELKNEIETVIVKMSEILKKKVGARRPIVEELNP